MAPEDDPYRTLGLARGATLDDVRRAYRRLVKANHPDKAGEAALSRFLAIQAAYDQIAGPDAGPRRTGGSPAPRRSWDADPDRAGATHRAYGGRTRRARASQGSRPGPGPGPDASPGSASDAGSGASSRPRGSGRPGRPDGPDREDRPDRPPNKATLGSTSYDGADAEPFEPDWGGASWYGTTSGTYWTLNPKEYADPRKHGPEYQARARRQRMGAGGDPAMPESQDPADATLGGPSTASRASTAEPPAGEPPTGEPPAGEPPAGEPPAGVPPRSDAGTAGPSATHTTASWWEATASEPRPTTRRAASTTRGHARPSDPRPSDPPSPHAPDRRPDSLSTDAVIGSLRAWLDDGRPGVGARVGRAVMGWAPIALGIGWLAGEVTGCGRFSADCDPTVAPVSWLVQIVTLVLLLLVPRAARVATVATIATLAAVIPGAILLLATSDPGAVAAGRSALGGLMVIAWAVGITYGLAREVRRPPPDQPAVAPPSGPSDAGPVS